MSGLRPESLYGNSLGRRWRLAIGWLAALGAIPLQAQPLDPERISQIGIDQRLDEQLPLDLIFNDEQGQAIELRRFFGDKPVVLTLVYYECPMLCTQVLNGLLRTMRMLSFEVGEDFEVLTVSFDPDETPRLAAAKKEEYVRAYGRPGAAAGWHFLTGSQDQIDRLAQAVGFRYQYDAQTDQYIHAAGIALLTPMGKLARYFYGVEYSPKDVRLGLIEAADNQIGSPVDQLLLLCYHYDPASGKYTMLVTNSVRVGGLLTLAALAAFVAAALRRERRNRYRKDPLAG